MIAAPDEIRDAMVAIANEESKEMEQQERELEEEQTREGLRETAGLSSRPKKWTMT